MTDQLGRISRSRFLAACAATLAGAVVGCEPEGTGTVTISPEARKKLRPGKDIDAGDEKTSRSRKKKAAAK